MAGGATGIVHYILGGGSYDTPVGLDPGGRWGEDINVQKRGGVGGVGVNVPGAQVSAIDATFIPVDANCLLDKVIRASYPNGALTSVSLEAGDDELGLRSSAWKVQRAVVTVEAEAALQMALMFVLASGKHSRTSGGGNHSSCPLTTFEWYRGHCKIAGSNAGIQRAEWTLENNVVPQFSLNEVASGSERFPEYGPIGNEIVSLALTALTDRSVNLTNDELQTVASVVATCVSNAGSPVTATITSTTPSVTAWDTSPSAHDALKQISYSMIHDDNSGNFALSVGS